MKSKRGFIYINSSIRSYGKGIFKIGKSMDADQRRREHNTALPYPQKTEKQWLVDDIDSAEKLLLKRLDAFRIKGQGAGTEFFKGSLKKFIKIGDGIFLKNHPQIDDDDHWGLFRASCLSVLRQRVREGIIGYKVNGKSAIPRLYAKLDSIGYRNVHSFYSWKHLKKEIADVKLYDAEMKNLNILKERDPRALQPRTMDWLVVDYHKPFIQRILRLMVRTSIYRCWNIVSEVYHIREEASKRLKQKDCFKRCLKGKERGTLPEDCICKGLKNTASVNSGVLSLCQTVDNFIMNYQRDPDTSELVFDRKILELEKDLDSKMPGRFLKTEKYIHSYTQWPWYERLLGAKSEPIYRDRDVYESHEQRAAAILNWTLEFTRKWLDHKECPGDEENRYCWFQEYPKRGKPKKSILTEHMEHINRFLTHLKPFALDTLNRENTFTRLYDTQNS